MASSPFGSRWCKPRGGRLQRSLRCWRSCCWASPISAGPIRSVLLVLSFSANTAFADFPRLCRLIAQDGYLPVPLAERGRRLVYTWGITTLALLCAALLILFGGVTDRLI